MVGIGLRGKQPSTHVLFFFPSWIARCWIPVPSIDHQPFPFVFTGRFTWLPNYYTDKWIQRQGLCGEVVKPPQTVLELLLKEALPFSKPRQVRKLFHRSFWYLKSQKDGQLLEFGREPLSWYPNLALASNGREPSPVALLTSMITTYTYYKWVEHPSKACLLGKS